MSEPLPPVETPPPATKRRAIIVGGAVVAALVIGAVACPGDLQVSGILVGAQWGVCNSDGSPVVTSIGGTHFSPQGLDPAQTQITFKDASGKVVATATTGLHHWVITPNTPSVHPSCELVAPYAVSLPRSDFYEVAVAGISQTFTVKLSDVTDGNLDITAT